MDITALTFWAAFLIATAYYTRRGPWDVISQAMQSNGF
jgi:hypothetical protein